MSHFTRIETEVRDLNTLKSAVERAGYRCQTGGTVSDYYGAEQPVDLKVSLPNQRDVGFARNAATGQFELVGDWWQGEKGEDQFMTEVRGQYARVRVLRSLEEQGIDLSGVVELEEPDGTVVFEVPLDNASLDRMVSA